MSSSLTVSAQPVKGDVKSIALALADVLKIPTKDLDGLDAAGVCDWLKKNLPSLENDKGLTTKPKQQKELCVRFLHLLGSSARDSSCGEELAKRMSELSRQVISAFNARLKEMESLDSKSNSDLIEKMSKVKSELRAHREKISSLERTASEDASDSKKWAESVMAALTGAPTLADMILLVCDSSSEISSAVASAAAASGGGCGCESESIPEFTGGWIHGGGAHGGLTIDTRIKKQTDERKKAMREFRITAESLFDKILHAVYSLGQRMGKGTIPMNDDLLRFKNSFSELENVYTPGIEYALTGFYVHATAVEQRERFLGKLQTLVSTLVPLTSGSNGDVFREIKTPLEELQKHCDKYSDMFRSSGTNLVQTKFGYTSGGTFEDTMNRARDALHQAPGAIRGITQDIHAVRSELLNSNNMRSHGGNDEYYEDEFAAGGNALTKAGLTLKNVTKSLNHFYSVAKMRENLKKVSSEAKSYSANYDEVLGKPFAYLIDKERKNFEKFKEELSGNISQSYVFGGAKIPIAAAYGTIKSAVESGNRKDDISIEWNKEAISTMQLNACNARIELYNVIQAIDLMLMNFTDSITANPDDVKEISKLLESTELVAEWFNEASGDHIAGLFEYMPWSIVATPDGATLETNLSKLGKNAASENTAIIDDKGSRLKKFSKGHYFEEVKKVVEDTKSSYPGNPFLMISPARAEYAREFARKTVERMLSLKNIVAAFSFMGSRNRSVAVSGGDNKNPWEPARIYSSLCKYLYVSAFAMGWDGYDANLSGDNKDFQQFAKKYESNQLNSAPALESKGNPASHKNDPNSNIKKDKILIGVLPWDNEKSWHEILSASNKLTDYAAAKLAKPGQLLESFKKLESDIKLTNASQMLPLSQELYRGIEALKQFNAGYGALYQKMDMIEKHLPGLIKMREVLMPYRLDLVKKIVENDAEYKAFVMPAKDPNAVSIAFNDYNQEKKALDDFVVAATHLNAADVISADATFIGHVAVNATDATLITEYKQKCADITAAADNIKIDDATFNKINDDKKALLVRIQTIMPVGSTEMKTLVDEDQTFDLASTNVRVAYGALSIAINTYKNSIAIPLAAAVIKAVNDAQIEPSHPALIAAQIYGAWTTMFTSLKDGTKASGVLNAGQRTAIVDKYKADILDLTVNEWKIVETTSINSLIASVAGAKGNLLDMSALDTKDPSRTPTLTGIVNARAKRLGGIPAIIDELNVVNKLIREENSSPMNKAGWETLLGLQTSGSLAESYAIGMVAHKKFLESKASQVEKTAYEQARLNGTLNSQQSMMEQYITTKEFDAIKNLRELDSSVADATYSLQNTSISGGGSVGYNTHNWIDYASAYDKGSSRGWIISYDSGNNAKDISAIPPFARCAFGCAMNSVPYEKNTPGPFKTVGGWSGQFRDTDELFTRTIKAMVAKVMTVSGLYNMLNFASINDHTLSATRFIIGGNSNTNGGDTALSMYMPALVPQIHEDAVELYIRLPLLVEFYRDVYSLTGKTLKSPSSSEELIIALVPEIDQTWSSLMRLSFDSIGSGAVVTKNYVSQMINEINVIYNKYKSKGGSNLVSTVVNDFIADVNSRFGIMTRLESYKYKEMMQATRREFSDANTDDVLIDFDTLGDRDFNERKAGSLPSDKFLKSNAGSSIEDQIDFNMGFVKALSDFRETIDKKIRSATYEDSKGLYPEFKPVKADFHEQARILKNELKLLTTPEQRFNAVFAVISGIDSVQKIDDNSHVMFHEVIIAPLAVLECIHESVRTFVSNVGKIWTTDLGAKDKTPQRYKNNTEINAIFANITRLIMVYVSSQSELVDFNITGPKVMIDHSKLQHFAENLLMFVSRNIQKFRSTIASEIISQYEGKIGKLQTLLIEKLFRSESSTQDDDVEYASRRITRLYGIFAKGKDIYAEGADDEYVSDGTVNPATTWMFGEAFMKLVYYDPSQTSTEFNVKNVLTRESRFEKLFMKKIDGKDRYMYEDLYFASRKRLYENKNRTFLTEADDDKRMGLMLRFNELLALYLDQFWDESTQKIYTPLVSGIAANCDAAVYKSQGWPDLCEPIGVSNFPVELKIGADWAASIHRHLQGDQGNDSTYQSNGRVLLGTILDDYNVSFKVDKIVDRWDSKSALTVHGKAYMKLIKELNKTSSSIAPIQLVNIIVHVFEKIYNKNKATFDDPKNAGLQGLFEQYRNSIISITGNYWATYGPIATIAAAKYASMVHPPPTRAGAGGEVDVLNKALKYYNPPGVVPEPLSEFSSEAPSESKYLGNPDEIMFASIAKIIKTMLTAQDKGIPMYALPSLTDTATTTPRMKENIRANLPIFTKMFGMIGNGCKILGNLLSTGINVSSYYSGGVTHAVSPLLGVQGRLFSIGFVDDKNKFEGEFARGYLSRIIGKISSATSVMITSSADVMKEVSDNPLYLETAENSISAYRNITNTTPFMPISSMLVGISRNTNNVDTKSPPTTRHFNPKNQTLLPVHSPGARDFEFNYGTRFVLGQPKIAALLDHTPGLREIVENYNKMVQNDRHITLENVSLALGEFIQLTRWVVDRNTYSPILFSLQDNRITTTDEIAFQFGPLVTMNSVMDLTTGTNKQRSMNILAEWVSKRAGGTTREQLDREKIQIFNILDLGINPVNINALRREVPLINILNYSFTFDSFAKDIMGLGENPDESKLQGDFRGMYLTLATKPYFLKSSDLWTTIASCYDDTSANLGFGGHDRFAQDQVFRKALLFNGDYNRTQNRALYDVKPLSSGRPKNTLRNIPGSGTPPKAEAAAYNFAYPKRNLPGHNRDFYNEVDIDGGKHDRYLSALGQIRHDTTFVRNILFISTMHRMMRIRLRDEMQQITFPVVSGPAATSLHVTDENLWETYDDVQRDYN